MKKLFALLILNLCTAFAANQYVAGIVFTNQPTDGNSLTVNGSTVTFKTSVTSPSTQVAIGATVSDTANNFVSHTVNFPYSGISPSVLNVTNVYLVADTIDFVITASKSGSWGTLLVTPNSIVIRPTVLPLSSVTPLTFRTNLANWLVLALRDYPSTNFPAGLPVFTNYVDVSSPKTITANWLISGAATLSNANQKIDGGNITNTWLRKVFLKNDASNPNGILTYNVSAVRFGIVAPDASGFLSFYDAAGGEVPNTPFNTTALPTTSGTYLWRGLADSRYARIDAGNVFSAANTFNGITTLNNYTGTGTNIVAGFLKAWVSQNMVNQGSWELTNSAPTMYLSESGVAANKGRWRLNVDGQILSIDSLNDDGTFDQRWFSIDRSVGAPFVQVKEFIADGGGTFDGNMVVGGNSYLLGKVYVGTDTAPTDTSGITVPLGLVDSSATASANPAYGTALWSYAGEAFYRTPTTSEGAGQNNRIHNRGEQFFGAGSAYALTTSYAEVVFGATFRAQLPSAGTYLLQAVIAVDADATTGTDSILGKFRNFSDSADVASSERTVSYIPNAKRGQLILQNIITVSAAKDIRVHAKNATSARGSIYATESSISYVRLY
jgi:hypothetical protein